MASGERSAPPAHPFPMDVRRSPQGVGFSHLADELSDLRTDWRATWASPPGPTAPVEPEPVGPHARQQNPEGSIPATKVGTLDRTLQDGKLLTKWEVLEYQVSHVSTAEGEPRQQMSQDSHGNEDYHGRSRKSTPSMMMSCFVREPPSSRRGFHFFQKTPRP